MKMIWISALFLCVFGLSGAAAAHQKVSVPRDTKGEASLFLGMGYLGKWLQPVIFQDYNPRWVYQEYLERFQRVDVNVVDKGVFVYPEA